jgi:hypothetical protein
MMRGIILITGLFVVQWAAILVCISAGTLGILLLVGKAGFFSG